MGLDDAVEDHLGLLGELFAAGQQVNSDDKADEQILEPGHHTHDADAHTAQDALYILQRGEQGGAQSGQVVSNGIVGIVEIAHQCLIIQEDFLCVHPPHEPGDAGLRGVVEGGDACDELRHHHHHEDEEEAEHEHEDEHEHEEGGGYDPHVWLSPLNAKREMENIKNAIAEADPANAEYYEANWTRRSKTD